MLKTRGFVPMPGLAALNKALAGAGLTADVVVVNRESGCEFGRRGLVVGDWELIQVATEKLTYSVGHVAEVLGLQQMSDGSPLLTTVGFGEDPAAIDNDDLVCNVRGAGFFPHANPHWPSLALVGHPESALDLALLMPFADSPPVWGVYIGKRQDGSWFVVPFTIMAIWHRLPASQGNLIRRTIRKVREVVEAQEVVFNYSNLWVFVGPGASQNFEFAGTRADKLSPQEQDMFVHTELIANPRAGQAGEPAEIEMPYLNLQGWVSHIFCTLAVVGERPGGAPIYVGVERDQLFVQNHNTVDSPIYTSKQTSMGTGPAAPGAVIHSNALVGVIRRIVV